MRKYPVNWITTELAVGYAPRSHDDLETIRAQGITAIVNLCAECYDLADSEKSAGFHVYFVPVPDEEAPAMEDLERAVAWIEDNTMSSVLLRHYPELTPSLANVDNAFAPWPRP